MHHGDMDYTGVGWIHCDRHICHAITQAGKRCKMIAITEDGLCDKHIGWWFL